MIKKTPPLDKDSRKRVVTEDQKESYRKSARENYRANKDTLSKKSQVRKYGLTVEQYDEMEKAQKNRCAICRKRETVKARGSKLPKRLSIDHDHKTGKVRGLLCHQCNFALGALTDNTDNAHSLINYLRDITLNEKRDIVFMDKGTPEWLRNYCKRMYSLFDLQSFSVNIHHTSRRAINRRLGDLGYASIGSADLAAAVIDPTYLSANLFFPAPMIESYESKSTVAHEFLHIDFRYHIFDKVKLALSVGSKKDDAKLLRIEEEAVEDTLSVLEKVGLFN